MTPFAEIDKYVESEMRRRMEIQEEILRLAELAGAESVTVEWPNDFGRRTRWTLLGKGTTRAKRRKALKIAQEFQRRGNGA